MSAFTLIELLTVIVIIAVLAALTIGAAKFGMTKAATSRTKGEIAAMETALEDYKANNGAYPLSPGGPNSTTNLYSALVGGSKKYYRFRPENLRGNLIIDAFGSELIYRCPGTVNKITYDLGSLGPDKTNGVFGVPPVDHDPDNITNWQQ